jgi:hypothetical protein
MIALSPIYGIGFHTKQDKIALANFDLSQLIQLQVELLKNDVIAQATGPMERSLEK